MAVRIYGSGVPADEGADGASAKRAPMRGADSRTMQPVVPGSADERLVETVVAFRLQALAPFAGCTFGDPFGTVVAIKGAPCAHPGERGFLDAPDGVALSKALTAIGYPADRVFGIQLGGDCPANVKPLVELVDPVAIVALDAQASAALLGAYWDDGITDASLARDGVAGHAKWICGRKAVLLDDFEGSLRDDAAKRRAWAALKELA